MRKVLNNPLNTHLLNTLVCLNHTGHYQRIGVSIYNNSGCICRLAPLMKMTLIQLWYFLPRSLYTGSAVKELFSFRFLWIKYLPITQLLKCNKPLQHDDSLQLSSRLTF